MRKQSTIIGKFIKLSKPFLSDNIESKEAILINNDNIKSKETEIAKNFNDFFSNMVKNLEFRNTSVRMTYSIN